MTTGAKSESAEAAPVSADQEVGRSAVRAGLVTDGEIQHCREIQSQLARQNTHKALLELLVEQGYLTRNQAQRLRATKAAVAEIPGYQILEKLGQGSMGVVYKARQLSINRIVALKVLRKSLATNREFLERFRREAEMAGQLSSNYIVQAIDAGDAHGHHYFVMEYVDGRTVREELERGKVYEEREALEIVLHVAEALQHAHKKGLVHRDIKPDNIIFTPEGVAKLADLGLARPTADEHWAKAEEGLAIGTPYYISPEQIRGSKDVDARADIYSLGATLYHMLTGRPPFPGKTPNEVMLAHLKTKLVPPDHVNTQLSGGVGEVVETMMAKSRDDRYASCADLLIDLKCLLGGEPPVIARQKMEESVLAGLASGEAVEAEGGRSIAAPRAEAPAGPSSFVPVLALLLGLSLLVNFILLLLLLGA